MMKGWIILFMGLFSNIKAKINEKKLESAMNDYYDAKMQKLDRKQAEKLVATLKDLDKQNVLQAKALLGLCNLYGIGTEKNVETGLGLIRIAIDGGDALAIKTMCGFYENGEFVEQDMDKALELFSRINNEAYYRFAKDCDDKEEALNYYFKSLQHNEAKRVESILAIGNIYADLYDMDKATIWLTRENNPNGFKYELSKFYEEHGDTASALAILNEIADDENNPHNFEAIERLANYYSDESNENKDFDLASKYLNILAEKKNDYLPLVKLGLLNSCLFGKHFPNYPDALNSFSKALTYCSKKLESNPQDQHLAEDKEMIRQHLQDLEKSTGHIRKMIEDNPEITLNELLEEGENIFRSMDDTPLPFYVEVINRSNDEGLVNFAKLRFGECHEYGLGVEKDTKKAVEIYRMLAESKYDMALVKLAKITYDGFFVDEDDSLSYSYFQEAAELGNDEAKAYIAKYTLCGIGCEQKVKEGFVELKTLAKESNSTACLLLGKCYERGMAIEPDLDKAFSYYTQSAELDNPEGCCALEMFVMRNSDRYHLDKKPYFYIKKAAYMGVAEAMTVRGYFLMNRMTEENDKEKGMILIQKAAMRGDGKALGVIATWYHHGKNGYEIDYDKAAYCYKESLKRGFTASFYNLGALYEEGDETHCPNYIEAARYYYRGTVSKTNSQDNKDKCRRAYDDLKENGFYSDEDETHTINANDRYKMAKYIFGNRTTEKEIYNALDMFTASADEGNIKAITFLADFYSLHPAKYNPKGEYKDFKDIDKAFMWYLKGAELNDGHCQLTLACFYEAGKGTKQDLNEALRWYKQAAANNEKSAYFLVGTLYKNGGEGLEPNLLEARHWYKLAVDNGDSDCIEYLRAVEEKLEKHE